ncbi:hypothetical protein ES708_31760 [subsurface metagenome]
MYKNGIQVDDANSVANPSVSPTDYIGRYSGGAYFKGVIDGVVVFDKALSQEEISYLYNNGDGTETIPEPNGLAVVTMLGLPSSPVTDVNGFYTDTVNSGFSDTVTPSKAGYTFTPTERVYSNVAEDHIGDNYTATLNTYTISGTVTFDGNGLVDVQMNGLPGDPCTDASGFYTATVDCGFSGTVTPTKTDYTFSPPTRSYSNVTTDQLNQDYEALPFGLPLDNFNDNRRGAAWRTSADDPESTRVVEDVNRLNVKSVGGVSIAASCVGHWKMNDNEPNTVVIDSSGKGNHGTARQNTSILHTDSNNPPYLNGALTFNGTSDYIDVGNVIGTGAYTKVAWVKREEGGNYRNNILSPVMLISLTFFGFQAQVSTNLRQGIWLTVLFRMMSH